MTSSPPNSGHKLQAVLFDMDGTLVDTEPYWIAAEYALVESFGGTWTDADAHSLVGNALIDSATYIRDRGGVALELPTIIERLTEHVVAASGATMPWQPGARELLRELGAAGVPCALVTMSYTQMAETVTAALPPGTFAAVVTGDQVVDGKPHPEAYLTAMERIGADPRRCVAIEDSPTGIASAEAAGCLVIGVPRHVPVAAAPGRVLVDSLADLDLGRLEQLIVDR